MNSPRVLNFSPPSITQTFLHIVTAVVVSLGQCRNQYCKVGLTGLPASSFSCHPVCAESYRLNAFGNLAPESLEQGTGIVIVVGRVVVKHWPMACLIEP